MAARRILRLLNSRGGPLAGAESIIKCNTLDLTCTRPCRRLMETHYQHLSAEERATIMILLQQGCSARAIART
ncbi:helix-turn-helix domain-containing protein, partial [Tepidimonas sp.]|uniref:helix-turn-helix domain-containing protein n=1 Tax=Tepidimonas sp. TaxID=2002775 RepID=UPI003919016E